VNRLLQELAALYREFVDAGEHDDFRELSGLLFGAKDRYRSTRATISYTIVGAVAKESNRRFVDWRFAQANPGMGIIEKPGPPQREDFYREYEDAERVVSLWHQRPDRWREERRTPQGTLLGCVVAAGRHGPLWMYELAEEAIYVPSVPERRDPDPLLAFMLDPPKRSSTTRCETTRSSARRAGGPPWRAGRRWRRGSRPSLGATRRRFSGATTPPRAPRTTFFSSTRRSGRYFGWPRGSKGREFYVAEVAEIAYDEELPEDTFRLEMPGVEFRRVVR
jgi:hypothetical protein